MRRRYSAPHSGKLGKRRLHLPGELRRRRPGEKGARRCAGTSRPDRCQRRGSTSFRTCPNLFSQIFTRAPASRSAPRPGPALPDGPHRTGGHRRALGRHTRRGHRRARLWRPTPLVRAERLERALGTPARIYYKDESVSPAGSHKPNTAVPQAFYNKQDGIARLSTETGAGQWGSALSSPVPCSGWSARSTWCEPLTTRSLTAAVMIEVWGASVVPSPVGDPDSPGSLGSAISDAVMRRGHARGHPLLARLGAQSCPVAPDGHRARGQGAAGAEQASACPTS